METVAEFGVGTACKACYLHIAEKGRDHTHR